MLRWQCPRSKTSRRRPTCRTLAATQTVTVVDDQPPLLTGCPDDETVECDSVPDPVTVTADDNCDGTVQVTYGAVTNGTCPTIITRTWSAQDACGGVHPDRNVRRPRVQAGNGTASAVPLWRVATW